MRIGSLFSGYGGLDIAVQSVLGGDLAWYSEIEPAACQVLAAHHPGVPNLGDITRVDWADVEPVDILTGGYPCQPFSHAGQRKGTKDDRHLWPYVRDAIAALRPVVTVLENVDGHRSLGLDVVLGDVAALGLSARWLVVRAADAGAPHGRKRVFIVVTDAHGAGLQGCSARSANAGRQGSRRTSADHCRVIPADTDSSGWTQDVKQPGDVIPSPSQGKSSLFDGHSADGPAATQLPTADAASGDSGDRRGRGDHADAADDRRRGVPTPAGGGARAAADTDRDGHGGGPDARGVGSLEAGDEGEPRERQRPRRESGAGGAVAWGKYAPAIHRWEYVLGRPAPDPTIPGVNGRPRLSPAFVEWMMGLPAGHVTGHGLRPAQCLKMLGNGVVPQQAALALRLILGLPAHAAPADGDVLPTPVASVSAPAPWKPGVDWWLQSRAARNLEAIVTGNTPHMVGPDGAA